MHSLLVPNSPRQRDHVLQVTKPCRRVIITQSPLLSPGLTPGVGHSVGLDRRVMICIHQFSTTRSICTALRILCASLGHPSSLETTDLSTVSIILPFSERQSWNHTECSLLKLASYI